MEQQTLTAVGNNILVIPKKEEEKKAGFEESKAIDEEVTRAIVHSVGCDVIDLSSVPTVKTGDEVIISKYGGEEFEHEGQIYKVVKLNDVFAVCGKK